WSSWTGRRTCPPRRRAGAGRDGQLPGGMVVSALADLVSLGRALAAAPPGHRPAPGLQGWGPARFVDGSEGGGPYAITRVMERTAVLEVAVDDRRMARHDAVLVDPRQIEWQPAEERRPRLGIPPRRGRVSEAARAASRER